MVLNMLIKTAEVIENAALIFDNYLWSPPNVSEIFPSLVAFVISCESYKEEHSHMHHSLN